RGQFAANPKGALRAGPYRELIVAPLSQRGAWFERRVGDVVHIVGLLQLPGCGGQDGIHVATLEAGIVIMLAARQLVLLQVLKEFLVRGLRICSPFGPNQGSRLLSDCGSRRRNSQ